MPTQNVRPMLNSVHAARALAALCVAALHFYSRESMEHDSILPTWMEFTRLGTDLFFVISGAVLTFSAAKRAQGGAAAVSFLYDRLTRVMPLYWTVTALTITLWLVSSKHLLAHVVGHPEFWSTVFLLPTGVPPAIPVAWSLVNLLFYYFVFALMIAAPRRLEPLILAAWAGLVIALRLTGQDFGSPIVHLIAHPAALEFIAGIALMRLALSGRRLPWKPLAILGLIWFAAFIYSCGPAPTEANFKNDGLRFLTLGVTAILFAGAAIGFDFDKPRRAYQITRFLGDTSFGVYLSHVLVIASVSRVWKAIVWPGVLDNVLVTISTFVGVIALGWLLHRFIETPARKITHEAKPGVIAALNSWSKRAASVARAAIPH